PGLDPEAVERPRLDGDDDRVLLGDRRFAVMDEQVVAAVLWIQVDLALPLDCVERLAPHRGHGGVLCVTAETAPETDAGNRPVFERLEPQPQRRLSPAWAPLRRLPSPQRREKNKSARKRHGCTSCREIGDAESISRGAREMVPD